MSKGKLLAIVVVWLVIAGSGAVAWRLFFQPSMEDRDRRAREQVIAETSGTSRYDHTIEIALDSFSGYAVLRSPAFQRELAGKAIRVRLIDDQADYRGRLRKLQSGDLQFAAFTIDALIKASSELNSLPAVIVSIIDETRGADAMVASKQAFPNVDALNESDTRFVLTPDSPSETLARVVMSQFELDRLASDPFVRTDGPQETMRRYRDAKANTPEVYVLWEPYVSEILKNEAMHVVVDSSRFRGYIVDVLVVNRDYLAKNEDVVRGVVSSYFTAAHEYQREMPQLVLADAKQAQESMSQEQAENLVNGIRWKNTQENLAHFGLLQKTPLQHVEDMITNITQVLMKTQAIASDPTEGNPAAIFNERVLRGLRDEGFFAGLSSESIAEDPISLPKLSPDEWLRLTPVGELKVPSLVFARGTARLTGSSQATLDELVQTLSTWPNYYVLVRGNAARQGPIDANRRVAQQRAEAAAEYLISNGVHPSRVHAIGGDPTGQTSVSFVLGEAPY